MKFLYFLTFLLTCNLIFSQPSNRQKRSHDKKYRVVYYKGGAGEDVLDSGVWLSWTWFTAAEEAKQHEDHSDITHTPLMTWKDALKFYDSTSRAAGIWDDRQDKFVRYWQPWYYLNDAEDNLRDYILKFYRGT